jgi:hypothetical protein
MKLSLLILALLCSVGNTFHVDKFFKPTQHYLHDIEKRFFRQTDTVVEEYSDKDLLSWAAPPDTKVCHSNELTSMQPGDCTWQNQPKNVVQSDGKNQAYTAANQKWRFLNPFKLNHSAEAPAMSPED